MLTIELLRAHRYSLGCVSSARLPRTEGGSFISERRELLRARRGPVAVASKLDKRVKLLIIGLDHLKNYDVLAGEQALHVTAVMKAAIHTDLSPAESNDWSAEAELTHHRTFHNERSDYFADLPEAELRRFNAVKLVRSFLKGATLFMQGQETTGVYVLREGKVKLSACSADGKTIILQIAEPGDVLGLSAAIEGGEYETSAVALADCRATYLQTTDLLRLLSGSASASFSAARLLSRNYQAAHRQICSLGLADSVFDKIARLLLSWAPTQNGTKGVRIDNFVTHEEIAGMIGASRETVTRTLKTFRERGLIAVNGRELMIPDPATLRAAAGITAAESMNGSFPLVDRV